MGPGPPIGGRTDPTRDVSMLRQSGRNDADPGRYRHMRMARGALCGRCSPSMALDTMLLEPLIAAERRSPGLFESCLRVVLITRLRLGVPLPPAVGLNTVQELLDQALLVVRARPCELEGPVAYRELDG